MHEHEDRREAAAGRDLDDRGEITELVRRFYARVAEDDLLGPVFEDVARVDWSTHLPKLTELWCRVLLGPPAVHLAGPNRRIGSDR
jgi:hemoglobin